MLTLAGPMRLRSKFRLLFHGSRLRAASGSEQPDEVPLVFSLNLSPFLNSKFIENRTATASAFFSALVHNWAQSLLTAKSSEHLAFSQVQQPRWKQDRTPTVDAMRPCTPRTENGLSGPSTSLAVGREILLLFLPWLSMFHVVHVPGGMWSPCTHL